MKESLLKKISVAALVINILTLSGILCVGSVVTVSSKQNKPAAVYVQQ